MSFANVIGNDRIKRILGKALTGMRFPNSVLFIGPEGTGKKLMALEVAKTLNCEREEDEACDECSACLAIMKQENSEGDNGGKKGLFPDVMVISPVKDLIRVDEIRILKQSAYLRPMMGRKKVFIIEEAEKMNIEASNSLLKVLEEPPDFSHIMLLTSNVYLILPTIQSRCQCLNFSPLSRDEIERDLRERGLDEEQARVMAQFVGGNLRKARELDWDEVQVNRNKAWNLFRALWGQAPASPFLQALLSSREGGRAQLAETLEIQSSFARDMILFKEKGNPAYLMNPDYSTPLEEMATGLDLDRALDFLRRIDYALYALKKNGNMNLLVNSFFTYALE